jgi:phosphodiesterase/alkaline phosphatase D-like protein
MTAVSTRRFLDHIHIPEPAARKMRMAARLLGFVSSVTFVVLALEDGVPHSSYLNEWEGPAQFSLFAIALIGYVLALRWEGVGGSIMVLGAIGLGILASVEYHPFTSLLACLAFFIPGGLFLLAWQRTQSAGSILVLGLVMATLAAAGGYGADQVYSYYFGPTHPESSLDALPVNIVEWVWAGGVTRSSVTVNAKLDDDSDAVRLAVSEKAGMTDAVYSGIDTADEDTNQRVVSFTMDGLRADTEYFYAIESGGELDLTRQGRFRTFPAGAALFTFAFSSCARTGSNGSVYDAIRENDPLFFLITGDFHYSNIEENDPDQFRDALDDTLTSPAQSALYRSTPIAYTWDDHDFGPNGADGTSASAPAAQTVYRQVVPHYTLAAGDGPAPIYQAFTAGRVRFIVTDTRSARSSASDPDGPGKTMLGGVQKAWFKNELLAANGRYPLIVWVNGVPWIDEAGEGKDTWGGYATERSELANFIADNEIRGLVMLSGDAHMLGIDDGTNSDYSAIGGAAFPVMHAAALDRHGSEKGGPYSEGAYPGSGQFGLMSVADDGSASIEVTWSGRNSEDEEIVGYSFTIQANSR